MTTQTRYFSCAETAKFVRMALKESFPGIKFSVKSHTYSGGASIRVGWTDGPNENQVRHVTARFAGATFDGMTDCKDYHAAYIDGQRVHFGADFIFTERKASDAAIERALRLAVRKYLGADAEVPSVEAFRRGELQRVPVAGVKGWDNEWNLETQTRRQIMKGSDRLDVVASPTAEAVLSSSPEAKAA